MIFEITEEIHPKTGAKRVLVYEDDGTLIMLTEKLYEGDETLEMLMMFEEESFCDGPQDG